MARRPTVIVAKRVSECPKCHFKIFPSTKCKVYSDQWYHMDCWNDKWEKVLDNKIEEESKQVEQDSQGIFIGLANSIEGSSSKIKE